MQEVLNELRMYEYLAENFETDNYPDASQEEIQQSKYEYMYLRNLADYFEIMMKKGKYSEEEMVERLREYFQKMYSEFKENSKKSIATKKKATILKNNAFQQVYTILEDALAR